VHPATDPTVGIQTPLDGTITKVEFYLNGTNQGEDTSAPFTFELTGLAAGTHSLTAAATDNSGARSTSTRVFITVVNPPQILQQDTIYTGGEFRLPMMLETGRSYLIQASTDLVAWTTIQAFQTFGSAIEFVDTEAGSYPGRFYRITLLE
jgi:hypothetical protein